MNALPNLIVVLKNGLKLATTQIKTKMDINSEHMFSCRKLKRARGSKTS